MTPEEQAEADRLKKEQEDADLNAANEDEEETIEEVRARLAQAEEAKTKAETIAENQRIRAEKAERATKGESPKAEPKATPPAGELAPKDLYALMEAKVPQQDVDEVIKAAKLLGKSVTEALQDDLVKTRLSQLAEFRKSAEVTSSGASKRTTTKVTDEMLIEKSEKGDDVDPEALAEARMNQRKKK
jgi:hypothetical protein